MSQETVKERRMAERGREKGKRTAADTEREALARSGTDRSGIRKRRAAWRPRNCAAEVYTVRLARGIV